MAAVLPLPTTDALLDSLLDSLLAALSTHKCSANDACFAGNLTSGSPPAATGEYKLMLWSSLRQQYLLQDLLALLMESQAHDKCLAVLRVIKLQPLPSLVLQSELICTIIP